MNIDRHPIIKQLAELLAQCRALDPNSEFAPEELVDRVERLGRDLKRLLDDHCIPAPASRLIVLQPHEERVMLEHDQLMHRHSKLAAYLNSPSRSELSRGQVELLERQACLMRNLIGVLGQRIARFGAPDDIMVIFCSAGYPSEADPLGEVYREVAVPLCRFNSDEVENPAELRTMTRSELDEQHPSMFRV